MTVRPVSYTHLSFVNINLAQQFIQENNLPLVGGVQFQGESLFILPQILIEQQNAETIISVFVETDKFDAAKAILDTFEKMAALLPLNQYQLKIDVYKRQG